MDVMVSVDSDDNLFPVAERNYNASKFAAACFSADNRFTFVNMQSFAVSYAIFADVQRPICPPLDHHNGWCRCRNR